MFAPVFVKIQLERHTLHITTSELYCFCRLTAILLVTAISSSLHAECDCHEEGSVSPQCLADGSCVCWEGVMGVKCSQCEENYFISGNGTCTGVQPVLMPLKIE